MAEIFPFRGYRYSEAPGDPALLLTQPYDKISPAMQARYYELSPHNLVRLILGERKAQDTETDNVYTRSAGYLEKWIESGILVQEPEPCLYAYYQTFQPPESQEEFTRKGLVGLGKVVDYSAREVYRHELTLTGPKQDRLQLLRALRAHPEQIFMLYSDPAGTVDGILDEVSAGNPVINVTDEYGTLHSFWRIAEPEKIEALRALMADKKLIIADGHHRYETALAFRDENGGLHGTDRMLMTFVNLHSPGLRILATHRVVSNLPEIDLEAILERARQEFRVEKLSSLEQLRARWKQPEPDKIRIGLMVQGENGLYLLAAGRAEGQLETSTLHEALLGRALGISEEAIRGERHLRYVRGLDAAAEEVLGGRAQMAFLLEPATVEQVATVSLAGGVMPQKSTDFYPKMLSGLTIYTMDR